MTLTTLGKKFSVAVLNGWVLHGSSLHTAPGHCSFLNTTISQGIVATRLSCDWKFYEIITINLLLSLLVKNL